MASSEPKTVGFKDESIYSQTINYVYPDGKVTKSNIDTFFKKNDKVADPNIMRAMEIVYGTPLTLEKLKQVDLQLEFDTEKIKEYIIANYKTGEQKTNVEILYTTLQEIDSSISKEEIEQFVESKEIQEIEAFADYVIQIIPK